MTTTLNPFATDIPDFETNPHACPETGAMFIFEGEVFVIRNNGHKLKIAGRWVFNEHTTAVNLATLETTVFPHSTVVTFVKPTGFTPA